MFKILILTTFIVLVTSKTVVPGRSSKNLQFQFPPLNVQGSISSNPYQENLKQVTLLSDANTNVSSSGLFVNVIDRNGNIAPLVLTAEQLPIPHKSANRDKMQFSTSKMDSKLPVVLIVPQDKSPSIPGGALSDDKPPYDPIAELIRIIVMLIRDFIRARRQAAAAAQAAGSGSSGSSSSGGDDDHHRFSDLLILPIL